MKIKVGHPYFEDINNKFVVIFYVHTWDVSGNPQTYREGVCVKQYEVDSLTDSTLIEKLSAFCSWLIENSYTTEDAKPPYYDEFKDVCESINKPFDEIFFDNYELLYFNEDGLFHYIFNESGERV